MIVSSVEQLIGKTPLLELTHIEDKENLNARILAKLEFLNPTGSAKDRAALGMIDAAEQAGLIKKGSVIIEPTSGNTGIGLASVGAARGYRVIIVMPDTMSEERRRMIKAYGAEIVLTDGKKGMAGAIEKAEELKKELGGFIPDQFGNPANAQAHFKTTGPEVWDDTEGKVDIFVAGIGTGGTITGTGRYLKSRNSAVKVIGIEPETSPLITKGVAGAHGLQGIGANFIPSIFDKELCDDILTVSDAEAYEAARLVCRSEGVMVGITSGAAIAAAIRLSKLPENAGKTIVALLPDSGDRYLSTALFA